MITYIKMVLKEAINNGASSRMVKITKWHLEKLMFNRSMTTFHQKMRMLYLVI